MAHISISQATYTAGKRVGTVLSAFTVSLLLLVILLLSSRIQRLAPGSCAGNGTGGGGGGTTGTTYLNDQPLYSTNSTTRQCLRYLPAAKGLPSRAKYDYIVVGSGAGGSTVARRLSDQGFTVALIEAGNAALTQPVRPPPFGMSVSVDATEAQPTACNRVLTTAEHVFGAEGYYDSEYTWNEYSEHWTVSNDDDVAQGPYTVQNLLGGRKALTSQQQQQQAGGQYMRYTEGPNGERVWANPPWGGKPVNMDTVSRRAKGNETAAALAAFAERYSSGVLQNVGGNGGASSLRRLNAPNTFPTADDNPSTVLNGIDFLVTQGKVAGGSTSINYMAAFWSSPNLLRLWGKFFPSFGVQQMQAAYKAIEHYHGDSEAPTARGSAGPIHVTPVPASVLSSRATNAFRLALDLPVVTDTNAPQDGLDQHAYELYQRTTTPDWVRSDAVTGMLKGADASKLDVITDSAAAKVLFDSTKRARAVRFVRDGKGYEVQADKVVLSAGYKSSQLLQLSGIGDPAVLQRFGIPQVATNTAVGKHGRNQFMTHFMYTVPGEVAELYNFTGNAGEMGGAFLTSPYARTVTRTDADGNQVTEKIRDVQILQLAQPVQIVPPSANVPGDKGAYLIYTVVVAVDNEVDISYDIENTAPQANPKVRIDWHNTATSRIRWGAEQMMVALYKMSNLEPNAALRWKYMPLSPVPADLEDDYAFAAFLRDNMSAMAHWSGGCNLGTVLNSDMSVKGVKGLYVADTSVLPFVAPDGDKLPMYDANGVLTIYAMAHVAADLVRDAQIA
jgi:choline dehydrogenase